MRASGSNDAQTATLDTVRSHRSPTASVVRLVVAVGLAAVVLSACLRAPTPPDSSQPDEYLSGPSGEPIEVEYTFPGEDQPTLIKAELVDGVVLIEGDIALGKLEDLAAANLAPLSHAVPTGLWLDTDAPNAAVPYTYEVPYEISSDFSDDYVANVIEPAIQHWNDNTNLRLLARNGEVDYVEFVAADNRCWSSAGRVGGRQEIRLDEDGCTRIATVIHEIGHAIGLKHEQQRSDREEYIEVIAENIDPADKIGNFTIYGAGRPLGAYGFTSIMHYGPTAFGLVDESGNRLETIRSITGDTIAPSSVLTAGDLAGVRRLYPERDLPFVEITSPAATSTVNEGQVVTFAADAVIAPELDSESLVLGWSYQRLGVPFTFGSGAAGEAVTHRFCDGVHDVTVSAFLPSQGVLATDTVRVIVLDLGSTNPPPQCPIAISIDEPLADGVYAESEDIALGASITDDHPETDVPLYPVIWRLDDAATGPIVGTGLESTTKLGAGQHTIHVSYGAARDSVTITVEDAGTPPSSQIANPVDESLHNWAVLDGVNTYLDIAFTGSASDAEDGALTGGKLVWEVREEGVGAFVQRGIGTSPTLRFPMQVNTVRYDVRLTATDSDGMVHSTTIQIAIVWPPS